MKIRALLLIGHYDWRHICNDSSPSMTTIRKRLQSFLALRNPSLQLMTFTKPSTLRYQHLKYGIWMMERKLKT